ncbi:AI-2E family transporter [Salinibacterium xinjiangense]|uniref:Predicted PurR-regulated permease PerM n=2 Tax=Salinibacterium xinjiangense TaxID=386302 RepID=A0A2C8ZX88_9MICO|nr:AI-2E family transporter [Salinibacterium xinjiangense]GGL01186.1 AI-2E family transporter [Salinibacterium xinjiangense]SOE70677.1 Predicted PurR-regulated permease PerM [Salinibacterium xinjiangense]
MFTKKTPAPVAPETQPTLRSMMTDRLGAASLRSGQIIVIVLLVIAAVFALVQLKLVVIPLLIALILASAASPVQRAMRTRGVSAILATWITLVAAIAVFGGIITLIVVAVQNQWDELAVSATKGIDTIQTFIEDGPIPIDQAQIDSARDGIVDFITSAQFGSGAVAGVSVAGEFIAGTVLMVVILFFFLKDGNVIWEFFLRPFSGHQLARGRHIGRTAVRTLGGYVRGTAVIAFVDASAIGIGLAILQVPLALPLAVIVFLFSFIPIVGATVAGALAALIALVASGPFTALIVVIIVVAVNQLEGNFLQPVVMAQSLKLHPLVILLALTAGTIVGGIVGAVLSVPIAAVAWAIIKVWNRPEAEAEYSTAAPAPRKRR